MMLATTLDIYLKRGHNNLNIVRLILAYMVIIGHAKCFFDMHPSFYIIVIDGSNFTLFGSVVINSFLFFSGLFVTNSLIETKDEYRYLVSRFLKVFPPLVFVLCISGLLALSITGHSFQSIYWRKLFRYVWDNAAMRFTGEIYGIRFLWDGYPHDGKYSGILNGSLWLISLEVKSYIALLGIHLLAKAGGNKYRIIFTVLLGCCAMLPFLGGYNFLGSSNPQAFYLLPCFCVGGILALYKEHIVFDWRIPISLFILGGAGCLAYPINCLLVFLAYSTFFLWVATIKPFMSLPCTMDISYGVYLWGWFLQQILVYYLHSYLNSFTFILSSILLSSLMGYLTYVIIERPCDRLRKFCFSRLFSNL